MVKDKEENKLYWTLFFLVIILGCISYIFYSIGYNNGYKDASIYCIDLMKEIQNSI